MKNTCSVGSQERKTQNSAGSPTHENTGTPLYIGKEGWVGVVSEDRPSEAYLENVPHTLKKDLNFLHNEKRMKFNTFLS